MQGHHPAWSCKELLAFEIQGASDSGHAQRFPCYRWLGRPECGGQDLQAELLPALAGDEEYEVRALSCCWGRTEQGPWPESIAFAFFFICWSTEAPSTRVRGPGPAVRAAACPGWGRGV